MKFLNAVVGAAIAAVVIVGAGAIFVFFKTSGVFVPMVATCLALGAGLGLAGAALGAALGAVGGHAGTLARVLGHGGLAAGEVAGLAYQEGMWLKEKGVIHLNSGLDASCFLALLAFLSLIAATGRAVTRGGFHTSSQAKSRYAGGFFTLLVFGLAMALLMHK